MPVCFTRSAIYDAKISAFGATFGLPHIGRTIDVERGAGKMANAALR